MGVVQVPLLCEIIKPLLYNYPVCYILIQGLGLLCIRDYTAGVVPSVTLTHNLGDGGVAYNGQRATFMCIIVAGQDLIITWSSDEYIGTGGVLQLTSADPPGSITSSLQNPPTKVTLRNTTRSSDGTISVTSLLQLVASALYPTSSISCRASGHGHNATVAFQTSMQSTTVMGKPEFTFICFVAI